MKIKTITGQTSKGRCPGETAGGGGVDRALGKSARTRRESGKAGGVGEECLSGGGRKKIPRYVPSSNGTEGAWSEIFFGLTITSHQGNSSEIS